MKVKIKLDSKQEKNKYSNPWFKNVDNVLSKINLLNIYSVKSVPTNQYDVNQVPGLFNNSEAGKRESFEQVLFCPRKGPIMMKMSYMLTTF